MSFKERLIEYLTSQENLNCIRLAGLVDRDTQSETDWDIACRATGFFSGIIAANLENVSGPETWKDFADTARQTSGYIEAVWSLYEEEWKRSVAN